MKRIVATVVIALVATAYVLGFWPQHRRVVEARNQIDALQTRLAAADARIRLADLLGQLLRLSDAVTSKNYGEAATLSSAFFDSVRTETARADRPEVRSTLQEILSTRDRITTAIAATEASLPSVLKEHERTLRQSLGFPVAAR